MYQKLLGDLKCTEELYKEYYLKDLQDNIDLLNKEIQSVKIKTLNSSAGKNGNAPRIHNLSCGTKLNNQISPNI